MYLFRQFWTQTGNYSNLRKLFVAPNTLCCCCSAAALFSSTIPGLATNSIFFCFLFVKTHWVVCLHVWIEINDPLSGKHYSLPFLPATPSSPSRNLEGLFELTRRPSRALDLPRALLPELQRYKDTVRCAALGVEIPGHRQQQTDANLDCAFVENALIYTDPWFWKVNRI